MRKIILDLRRTVSREELHDIVAAQFAFPDYYGRNLDALYDLLSACATETAIGVMLPPFVYSEDEDGIDRAHPLTEQGEHVPAYLDYLRRFCRLLSDIEAENPRIAVFLPLSESNIFGEDHELEI